MIETYIVYKRNDDSSVSILNVSSDVSSICQYVFNTTKEKLMYSYFDIYNNPIPLGEYVFALKYRPEKSSKRVIEAMRKYSIKQILK